MIFVPYKLILCGNLLDFEILYLNNKIDHIQ